MNVIAWLEFELTTIPQSSTLTTAPQDLPFLIHRQDCSSTPGLSTMGNICQWQTWKKNLSHKIVPHKELCKSSKLQFLWIPVLKSKIWYRDKWWPPSAGEHSHWTSSRSNESNISEDCRNNFYYLLIYSVLIYYLPWVEIYCIQYSYIIDIKFILNINILFIHMK